MSPMGTTAAADAGNATTVVALGAKKIMEMPTAKASMGYTVPDTLANDDTFFHLDGGTPIAVGLSALRYADEPTAARGHSDRYKRFTRDLILAGIGAQIKDEVTLDRLVVTMPAKFHGGDLAATLAKTMTGTFAFTLNRRRKAVTVKKVVVVREGEAAWYAVAAKHAGAAVVIDGGGGTTHMAVGRNGKLVDVVTRDTGIQRMWDMVDRAITEKFGQPLTMWERYELERALAARAPYAIRYGGKDVRIDTMVAPYLVEAAAYIADDLKTKMPWWEKAEALYYVGGQALLLGEEMQTHFDRRLIIPKSPVTANAVGALLMGGATMDGEV